MITSIVYGGLGNQMLHYAIGRSLALKYGVKYCLDLSMYEIFKSRPWMREYELRNVFSLPDVVEISSSSVIKKTELLYLMNRKNKFDGKLFQRLSNIVCIADTEDQSDRINRNSTLYGLDHSIRYFKGHISEIKRDFAFKTPLEGKNKMLADEIQGCKSLSLHIRRGDYLNANNIDSYVQVEKEWYYNAIDKVMDIVGRDMNIYVFSDDIPWCREVFSEYKKIKFIDWNIGKDSYRDMQLMSLCKHNIIANSTFSRMAALINANEDQIVICPSHYLKNEKEDMLYFLELPKNWIII